MLYIFSLALCLFLAVWYDILGQTNYKQSWYYFLMIYFIAISGCQFQVGADIPLYMIAYESFDVTHFKFLDIFDGGDERRQPGWMLLTYLCRLVTDDFFLFKMLSAIFLNVSIFSFFKRESKTIFVCIFLYALIGYLVLNFNAMRQAYSLGFALYGYSYLKRDDYKRYFLCVIGGILFHNSAFVLLLPLFFKFLKYNKYYLSLSVIICIVTVYLLISLDFSTVFVDIFSANWMSPEVARVGMGYMQNENLGIRDSASIFSIKRLFYLFIITYTLLKKKDIQLAYMGYAYLVIDCMSSVFPIIWRFRLYFDLSFIVILAQFLKCCTMGNIKGLNKICMIVVFAIVIYLNISDYFSFYPYSKMRYIDQYYPYHSVFNPVAEYDRLNFFN